MRSFTILTIVVAAAGLALPALAELQEVTVGGQLRIRGNVYEWEDSLRDSAFVEARTRLSVSSHFTDDVAAFIEFDSYDIWGEDFRSNYVTGLDGRAVTGDDVEIYQAYIDAQEMWGAPLRLRVGRQEIALGNQWLVGVNDSSSLFTGLSFDALRLTYATDMVSVDAIAAKLAETLDDFGDGDADLYGLYGSYLGIEDVVFDLYWLFVRDDTGFVGNDADLHTVGLRAAGVVGGFDFDAEAARQFGGIEWALGEYDYEQWGANLEAGYTFDVSWQPRVYLGFAYLGGEEKGLGFNRLFSNVEYTEFLANTDLSNALVYRAGLGVMPTECLDLGLDLYYIVTDAQMTHGWFLGWWTEGGEDANGLETNLHATYHYTEDLAFRAGWAHFFTDAGVEEGNFVTGNGLLRFVADEDDDYDYLYLETELSF